MRLLMDNLRNNSIQSPDDSIYRFIDGTNEYCLSNKVLYQKAMALAYELSAQGLKKTDRAVILCTNSPDNIWSMYGCMMAGVAFTLIPPPLDVRKQERLMSVVKTFRPSAIISNSGLAPGSRSLQSGPVTVMADQLTEVDSFDYTESVSSDLIYVQYSSGSTSAPKGVKVSEKNLTSNLEDITSMFPLKSDRFLGWVPFYHSNGLLGMILSTLSIGRETYIFSLQKFLENPELWLQAIQDYKPEITVAPNSAYNLCAKIISEDRAKQLDLSSLKLIFNGSENVSYQTLINFCDKFSVDINKFTPGYGLAEAVCLVSAGVLAGKVTALNINYDAYKDNRFIEDDEDPTAKGIVSVGKVAANLQAVIVNPETHKPCLENEIGELCLTGESVCDGYWEDIPENENFQYNVEGIVDERGLPRRFLRTGDMGALYKDELFITGRRKELIIINGQNFYPYDIIGTIQKEIPELSINPMCAFSLMIGSTERALLCIETLNDSMDFARLAGQINETAVNYFEFSFYDIVFLKANTMSRTDNGKLQVNAVKCGYEENALSPIYSRRTEMTKRDNNEVKGIDDGDEVEATVKLLFGQILSIEARFTGEAIEKGSSFLELGGNSFDMIELTSKLENQFNIPVDLKALVSDPTVSGIACYVKSLLNQDSIKVSQVDWRQEGILPEDIRPEYSYDAKAFTFEKIFLTGATGFLGTHLLDKLIRNRNKDTMKVYCHVRAKDLDGALTRIKESMVYYDLWQDSYENYIVPVLGDLREPLLGVNSSVLEELSQTVDVIYHNGALVNFMFPYSFLKRSNVDSTLECLRLACQGKPKRFNYISTYSVYDNPSHFRKTVYEDDPLDEAEGYLLGYSESKWVSEKLVQEASRRGLITTIFRPGDIVGGSTKGIWKIGDLTSRLLVSSMQTGTIPEIEMKTSLIPVDYVSSAIIGISQDEKCLGKVFNIVNKDEITTKQLMGMLQENGHTMRVIPFEEWQKNLLDATLESNALKALDYLFRNSSHDERSILRRYADLKPKVDMTNTFEFIKRTKAGYPILDAKVMALYIDNFKKQIEA